MSLEVRSSGDTMPAAGGTVVLLHGFGGTADDLLPFAGSMGVAARFVFPIGPIDEHDADLASGAARAADALGAVQDHHRAPMTRRARAWWPIDVAARDAAMARGEKRDLSSLEPEGLASARAALNALLDRMDARAPLIIGGFSQGAMLATDLMLRGTRPLSGLVILSGARICATTWGPLLARRAGLPVFMSHGRSDAHLSFAVAEGFAREMSGAGLCVTWCPFDGGHEIPLVVLRGLKKFLSATTGGAPISMPPRTVVR